MRPGLGGCATPLDREEIARLFAAGEFQAALALLREYWYATPTLATARFIVNAFEQWKPQPLVRHRVSVLRSWTVEPVLPALRALGYLAGLDLILDTGDFNNWAPEILDANSRLYAFEPQTVILAAQTRDVAPELWNAADPACGSELRKAVERVAAQFAELVAVFRGRTQATLVVHGLESPASPGSGLLDATAGPGQCEAIAEVNAALRRVAAQHAGIYILDYDALVARHGKRQWHDQQQWLLTRTPIRPTHVVDMAREWMRFLHPIAGKLAKAVVVDLDNTLWGGVVGEDGPAGLKMGLELPGAAYRNVQRVLLDLRRRGILLAICSKNNEADALEVLQQHPDMVLRPEHFSARRINWQEKAANLREIAAELNLGLDALAFIDDNPVERRQVRVAAPEVWVLDLPSNPLLYADAIRECPLFERLALTSEDARRGEYYRVQQASEQLRKACSTTEEFLRSLEQRASVAAVNAHTLQRVAQLTQKTNQFNLTTRRYTEAQIQEMAEQSGCEVLSLAARDRYGDHGLVGVAILKHQGAECEIDTFLLSCRVIGRTLETALLAHIVDEARRLGCAEVRGWFYPTAKNTPAGDFYARHGFKAVKEDNGATLWSLALDGGREVAWPEWIRREYTMSKAQHV